MTKAATGIAAGAVVYLGIAFWRSNDWFVTFGTLLGGLGWLAWWYVCHAAEAREPAAEIAPVAESAAQMISETVREQGNAAVSGAVQNSSSAQPEHAEDLAKQLRLAMTESEQAVSVAIASFSQLSSAAQDITECTVEMKNWRTETNPLVQNTLGHVAECSLTINKQIEQLIKTFQFQDMLRQRLEYTASVLDGSSPVGDQNALFHSPALQPADYGAEHGNTGSINLF